MDIAQLAQEVNKELNGGTFLVDDIRVGHTVHEVKTLHSAIATIKPNWFVEIGVHEGGLSYLLIPNLPETINYLGVEINCSIIKPEVKALYKNKHTQLHCADCFESTTIKLIGDLQGRKMIYCDGGNKAKELFIYKNLLNVGDWILAHDYWDEERKITDCREPKAEVTPQDIQIYRKDHDFVELGSDRFLRCRIVGFLKSL